MFTEEDTGQSALQGTPSTPAASYNGIGRVRNEIINEVTDDYISHLSASPNITPEQIEKDLLKLYEESINLENGMRSRGMVKYTAPTTLPLDVIAQLMTHVYNLRRISCAGVGGNEEYDLIGLYMDDGPDKGTYSTSEIDLMRLARRFNRRLTKRDYDEVMFALKAMLPRTERCMDRDLIAVNNGIFDYKSKTLLPFTPDLVLMAKSHVDYNPKATNVVIHNDEDGTDWDVETWMSEFSDDPEVVNVLWQILGAIIRPNVAWNKAAWLYATTGNNGKGTLCALMRNLCGKGTHTSIPLANFAQRFALEPLIHASAIIVDENAIGKFIDDVANLKAIITNDVVPIDRKHKQIISFQFHGFMVQCLNEMPRIRDKSDSFYRRQLFIEFTKSFTGHERKYIKDDYLKRPEVLEYVLKRVMTMPDYYELDEPASCKQALEEYKEYNDPVRSFCVEILPQCQWDLLPYDFLYELYKAWFAKNNPNGSIQGRNKFIDELRQYVSNNNSGWMYPGRGSDGKEKQMRSKGKMIEPEPLILEYDLKNWYNPDYTGHDPNRACTPKPKAFYRGLFRVSAGSPDVYDGNNSNA